MAINQVERAYRAWPILTRKAYQRSTITYGELGHALGIHHRAVRYVLGVIQDYCLEEGLPPLTILIINASGKPGSGFIAFDLNHFEEGLTQVYDYDWKSLENPFGFSASGDSYKSLVLSLTNEPESSSEIYTRIKSRGIKQIVFRDALLKTYATRCAFTEISIPEALEACHIIPWAQASESERMDVRNGLLLNSLHHKLFDNGYITLSTEHEIIYYDPHMKDRSYSKFDKALTSALHGRKMHVPHRVRNRPLAEYISRHHELAGWGAKELEI